MWQQMALFHSFLWLRNIPLWVYTTLSLSIYWSWTFRLLPCLGYCKLCCYEHQGGCIFSTYGFLFTMGIICCQLANNSSDFLKGLKGLYKSSLVKMRSLSPKLKALVPEEQDPGWYPASVCYT